MFPIKTEMQDLVLGDAMMIKESSAVQCYLYKLATVCFSLSTSSNYDVVFSAGLHFQNELFAIA